MRKWKKQEEEKKRKGGGTEEGKATEAKGIGRSRKRRKEE